MTTGVGLGIFVLGGAAGWGISQANESAREAGASAHTAPAERDFLFQVVGYETQNQGGQLPNMYFRYRYDNGIQTDAIPNYEDLRSDALDFMDAVDAAANPYWEVPAEQFCSGLSNGYPLESISCQLQVYPDDRVGLPHEPGYHGTTYTIGDIEPLAVPGPTSSVQQCDVGVARCDSQ